MLDDLSLFYNLANGDAELVTVFGVPGIVGIFSSASEVALGEAVVIASTLRVPASVVAGEGGACVVRGVSYRIRKVLDLPPDGRERLLVLAKG